MSYGPSETGPINVGKLAHSDPLMARASLMASRIMLDAAKKPAPDRRSFVKAAMNDLWPGMGYEAFAEIDKLTAAGKPRDQAIFDGLRLTIANRLMEFVTKIVNAQRGVSGLGSTSTDIRSVGCLVSGMSATAGGWAELAQPGVSSPIVGAANAGAAIQGCGIETMNAQANLARANTQQAADIAMRQWQMQANQSSSNLTKYAVIGGGALALLLTAAFILKK